MSKQFSKLQIYLQKSATNVRMWRLIKTCCFLAFSARQLLFLVVWVANCEHLLCCSMNNLYLLAELMKSAFKVSCAYQW